MVFRLKRPARRINEKATVPCLKREAVFWQRRSEILQKKLEIAVNQLKDTYTICFRNKSSLLHTIEHNIIGGIERDCAIALQQIKEIEE